MARRFPKKGITRRRGYGHTMPLDTDPNQVAYICIYLSATGIILLDI